jgi:hypothetical protein
MFLLSNSPSSFCYADNCINKIFQATCIVLLSYFCSVGNMFQCHIHYFQTFTHKIVLVRYRRQLGSYFYLISGLLATCFGLLIHHEQTVTQNNVLIRYTVLLGSFYYLITVPSETIFGFLIHHHQAVTQTVILVS